MTPPPAAPISTPVATPPSPPLPRAPGPARRFFAAVWDHHVLGAFGLVLLVTAILAGQVEGRVDFASSELAKDVQSRWGAPVTQAAPSVRWVQSGSVFTELKALALSKQHVNVDATMSYRKRGLVYFSGFDFAFTGHYAIENPEAHDIDVAFVFPLELDKSQVLLSDLSFEVDGQPASLDLGDKGERLLWTGRLAAGKTAALSIRYRARGLDSFVYRLDPQLPARDLKLHFEAKGGDNFDYPANVLSAESATVNDDGVVLDWSYPSLESGVALGVVLPSQKSYDRLAATMASRAWLPALAFLAALALLSLKNRRPLMVVETYLAAAVWAFFFVLLAYLGAFIHFYLAYAVCVLGLGAALSAFLWRLFPHEKKWVAPLLWVSTVAVPSGAVVLQGYTGLIYTLEVLSALLTAMVLITRPTVRALVSDLLTPH